MLCERVDFQEALLLLKGGKACCQVAWRVVMFDCEANSKGAMDGSTCSLVHKSAGVLVSERSRLASSRASVLFGAWLQILICMGFVDIRFSQWMLARLYDNSFWTYFILEMDIGLPIFLEIVICTANLVGWSELSVPE